MKKDWKLYEIILTIIAIILLLTVIFSFLGVLNVANVVIGLLLFIFYLIIAFLLLKQSKLISGFFVIVAIISALPYML